LANQFDGPFLVRLIRKEVTHISGFPFGIESRDPDIPSCWHSGTMRRSCCWSIPCHNQANPLPTNDTPASDIPQRFQSSAILGDGGVGNRKVRYRSARIPSPPSRGGRSLYGRSPAQSEQLYCWIGRRRIISAENRGNSCHASILALGPSCASHRRSSNANSLMRPEFGWITGICATFQRDILRRHFGVRVASQAVRSLSASGMKGSQSIWAFEPPAGGLFR